MPGPQSASSSAVNETSELSPPRILVVDDDPDAGRMLVMILGLRGHKAEFADGLTSAIACARRIRPQVVLVDIAMPDADGYEVARQLRLLPEMPRDAHYIVISGYAQPADYQRSDRAGMTRHLVKPVDTAKLDRLLRELLGCD